MTAKTTAAQMRKPSQSYIALIAMAIQSDPSQQALLGDIYRWISHNYPYYQPNDKSWRNSIRHNLSLNECFVKSSRCESGKGHYWAIHPANVDDFARGDFRRRRARLLVRRAEERRLVMHTVDDCTTVSHPNDLIEPLTDEFSTASQPNDLMATAGDNCTTGRETNHNGNVQFPYQITDPSHQESFNTLPTTPDNSFADSQDNLAFLDSILNELQAKGEAVLPPIATFRPNSAGFHYG